ncbi:MAG: hypothetical protein AAFX95_03820 [Cyanobacteria bacterium J06639_16]
MATPLGYERQELLIGYDAEVKFTSGKHFVGLRTHTGSRLLSNELWRLKNAEDQHDGLGFLWLENNFPVRGTYKGISGTSLPGRECAFYVHPDEYVVTQILKDIDLELKPNEHTRYAQGLVKRFGGIEKVFDLLEGKGFEIISALSSLYKTGRGAHEGKIFEYLAKHYKIEHKELRSIFNSKMSDLLKSGLVRRGYSLECPHCNLNNFILLERVKEIIDCEGCADEFQLPLENLKFSYELNELSHKLIQKGGLTVLMTAATLKKVQGLYSSFIQFGGDIFPIGKNVNTNEVDLFFFTENGFVIAECKSLFGLNIHNKQLNDKIEDVKKSLIKNIGFAEQIGAKVIFFGVTTNLPNSEIKRLFEVFADLLEIAKAKHIGLHLVLNEQIYVEGSLDGVSPRTVTLASLWFDEKPIPDNTWSVGESPSSYGGAFGVNGLFDKAILDSWLEELKA